MAGTYVASYNFDYIIVKESWLVMNFLELLWLVALLFLGNAMISTTTIIHNKVANHISHS